MYSAQIKTLLSNLKLYQLTLTHTLSRALNAYIHTSWTGSRSSGFCIELEFKPEVAEKEEAVEKVVTPINKTA